MIPPLIYRDFLPLIPPQYLSIYRDFFFNRSSIPSQSIELRFLYILLRSDPILHLFKYLDLSHLSLDPNPFFSLKSFLFLHLRPTPSLNLLVSLSNPSFFIFSFIHAFIDLGFSFWENFGVFVYLSKFLGWVLLKWSHMFMYFILCSL